ncbi:hypothetical protein LINGRAHAP2_LOCUS7632 [Linum grandiflorum]
MLPPAAQFQRGSWLSALEKSRRDSQSQQSISATVHSTFC